MGNPYSLCVWINHAEGEMIHMTKDQILADFAFLYERAIEEGRWGLAIQVNTAQAKMMGLMAPQRLSDQDLNASESAAKERILANFAFIYQRTVEEGKWTLAFRARIMQAKIMRLFIHERPKAPKPFKSGSSNVKALESLLPAQPELRKPKSFPSGSPEAELLKMFSPPAYQTLQRQAGNQTA